MEMIPHQGGGGSLAELNRYSAAELRERVNIVQKVMREVMKEGTHYGTIPGTNKPTLYKPGAEMLCVVFRIAQVYVVEDLSTPDAARFRVRCIGRHQASGIDLGEGVGECSSDEEKYRWRGAVCAEEFDDTPENLRRIKYAKFRGNVEKKKQVRTEPADLANTVLKMACKRALTAMTLNVTAASDMFTQDIEDLPEELRGGLEPSASTDPALRDKWVAAAAAAANADELKKVWTQGVAEIKAAQDMPAYAAFKEAVERQGMTFAKPAPAEQGGDA